MAIKTERKKLTRGEVRKILHQFKHQLTSEQIPFNQIILFGSYAQGRAHIDSDIDVAVIVSDRLSRPARQKVREVPWLAKQINVKLEPHLLTKSELKNPYLTLPYEIRRYGKPLK